MHAILAAACFGYRFLTFAQCAEHAITEQRYDALTAIPSRTIYESTQTHWPAFRKRADFSEPEVKIDPDMIMRQYAKLDKRELNIGPSERVLRVAAGILYNGRDTRSFARDWASRYRPDLLQNSLKDIAKEFLAFAIDVYFALDLSLEQEEQIRTLDAKYRDVYCLPPKHYQLIPPPEPQLAVERKRSDWYKKHPWIHETIGYGYATIYPLKTRPHRY